MKIVHVVSWFDKKKSLFHVCDLVFTEKDKAEGFALSKRGESLDYDVFVDDCVLDEPVMVLPKIVVDDYFDNESRN